MTTVAIADVARSLKMSPKVARAKVRKYEGSPAPVKGEQYVYPASAVRALKAFLKS